MSPAELRALRCRLGLSRPAFAARYGLDHRAVESWEQGRREPDLAARTLLAVIAADPEAVERALRAETLGKAA
jgi:putative transcriptional regulator